MDDSIKNFLKSCNIVFEEESQLDGLLIPREVMLSENTYESVKDQIVVRALDFVRVMGKTEPVNLALWLLQIQRRICLVSLE